MLVPFVRVPPLEPIFGASRESLVAAMCCDSRSSPPQDSKLCLRLIHGCFCANLDIDMVSRIVQADCLYASVAKCAVLRPLWCHHGGCCCAPLLAVVARRRSTAPRSRLWANVDSAGIVRLSSALMDDKRALVLSVVVFIRDPYCHG